MLSPVVWQSNTNLSRLDGGMEGCLTKPAVWNDSYRGTSLIRNRPTLAVLLPKILSRHRHRFLCGDNIEEGLSFTTRIPCS